MAWQPPETAPKTGKAFLITSAGPQVDICFWDSKRSEFVDYFYKQRIAQKWPYLIGWQELPTPAIIKNSEEETRQANGWP